MKKIALVTYSLKMGGVENVLFNLSKSFSKKGYYVEIIETLEEGVWKSYFVQNNLKVISIVQQPLISSIDHVKKLARYLNNFDIVLLNDAPFAQSIIGQLSIKTLVFPVMHMALPIMASNASSNREQWNKIIAVSPLLKAFLLSERNNLQQDDIVVIPNGVDIDVFKSVVKFQCQKKKVLFLGRISEEKGIELLPQIINQVKKHKLFGGIDIYGSGSLDEFLKSKIELYGLSDIATIKGAIPPDEVFKVLPNYDILLMPSYKEGHPIVLLEAMACGLVPVVSLLAGSTDTVVDHGINGYLCESGNLNEFVENLSLALDIEDLQAISNEARNKIEREFSVENMVDKYIMLFKDFDNTTILRSNKIEIKLLNDFPYLPYALVRPIRKVLRVLGLW